MTEIFSLQDPLTTDGLRVAMDGERVAFESVVAGRPRRVLVIDRESGRRLARALLDELPSGSGS